MGSNSSKGQWRGEFEGPKRPKHLQRRVRDILKQRKKQMQDRPIIPLGSPADTVAKQVGDYFVLPFSYDMCGGTDGIWPLGGSFDPSKIKLLNEMVREEMNPDWDYGYMRICAAKWEEIARKHKPPKAKSKPSSASIKHVKQKHDETLCLVLIAAHTSAADVQQLSAALQIWSTAEEKIMNKFPDKVRKQATALIHWWIDLQPQPSVEGLLRQLRCGGVNLDWLIQEKHESPPQLPQSPPQLPEQPVDSKPADIPHVKAEEGKESIKEKEDGNIPDDSQTKIICVTEKQIQQRESERVMDADWFFREFRGQLTNIPNPLTKLTAFHTWLRVICIICNMRPAGVSMLLDLAYGSKWKKVSKNFHIPSADWPNIDSLTAWLDGACVASIEKSAWENADFLAVMCCYQKPKEPVTDFLQRFEQVWDSSVGVAMDYNSGFTIFTLVNCLQPDVAEIFKLQKLDWQMSTFAQAKNTLSSMEHMGMFESQSRALQTWSGGSRQSRRDKRRDQCFSCGRFGHWARDCRAKRRDQCFYCGKFGHWARDCRARIHQHALTYA
ncbi:uncharacterized protein [Thunnus thynnus]|uniref:uncharacterized protein n=1 Tax=Thunnus thynnus TaxID=8237 RepID=UPI003529823C